MTQSQWLSIVAWMCELWPHSPIEPATAGAWWPFVAEIDHTDARRAVATLALEPGRRWPPGVGDIVHAATVDDTRDWFEAWSEVYDAIAGTSGRARYEGDDPSVARFVAQLGEWRQHVDETSPALRAQFRDFYRSQADRHDVKARAELAGEVIAQIADDSRYLALTGGTP